jgi:hypothetical protein
LKIFFAYGTGPALRLLSSRAVSSGPARWYHNCCLWRVKRKIQNPKDFFKIAAGFFIFVLDVRKPAAYKKSRLPQQGQKKFP